MAKHTNIQDLVLEWDEKGSTKQVAQTLGVTMGTMSRYRVGAVKHPRYSTACDIYALYDVVVEPYAEESLKKSLKKGTA